MGSLEQVNGESNPMAAFDVKKETPTNNTHEGFDLENQKRQKPGWIKFLAYVGPGFLVSLAYLDPGNMETDLQAGAQDGFELLWVILIGMIFALIIQSLAANLGVSTGKHLSELCKAEYPIFVKYCLWLLAEVAVVAADVPEACFFGEMGFVKPPAVDLLKGLFVPKLSGQTAVGDAIALLGALIMP
ncbi:hypothetical protein RHGRI_025544 [Rhododendron griersonianum]|uniref:Uncharacterized protein n=1 Tax=Rhododendron griersonianum TaxID=479676 RepID=A0AAV6IU27_9ERIC|nr:hypothetical protein RHGRI_025544 [Rhododendron griersonianum]